MNPEKPIGAAARNDDGTATLFLRAEGPGMIGDAQFTVEVKADGTLEGWRLSRPLRRPGDTADVLPSS